MAVYIFKLFGFCRFRSDIPIDTLDEFFPSRAMALASAYRGTEATEKVVGVRPPHHVPGRRVRIRPRGRWKHDDSTELCGSGWMGYYSPQPYVSPFYRPFQSRWEKARYRWCWHRHRPVPPGRFNKRFPHRYRLTV